MVNRSTLARGARHYLAGLVSASWNGGIGAVAGILGIDSVAMTSASSAVRILNWHEMLAAFGGAFILHGIFWLKAHPLPEQWESNTPFFPLPKKPEPHPPDLPTS